VIRPVPDGLHVVGPLGEPFRTNVRGDAQVVRRCVSSRRTRTSEPAGTAVHGQRRRPAL